YLNNVKRLSDSTLVAITILIAESKPSEKEIIIDLIMNFLTIDKL
ncbi:MAG: phosphoribosylaminoimidazolesuccinocarboxamide synthase, partial [Bacilli bacterium]|nr:phosphoribosylaminoimidazolesuccinocarboxamide synthase [Bacilli bacterium]